MTKVIAIRDAVEGGQYDGAIFTRLFKEGEQKPFKKYPVPGKQPEEGATTLTVNGEQFQVTKWINNY